MDRGTHGKPIRAFIFDMDDTLAATAAIWRDAEQHLLHSIGACWSPELAAEYKGMNALDLAATVHRRLRPAQALSECRHIIRGRLLQNFRDSHIREIDGATRLVNRCAALGRPAAVASGSPMEAIELTLNALGISDMFQCAISSEQVPRGKPHPDIFLAAAAELSVAPEACLVFEDSLIGAAAAHAAGMRCIVRPSIAGAAIADLAMRTVTAWDQVTLDDLT